MKDNKPYVVALGICKNEEKNLARWYENVRKIADEVILLDTGSTDETPELAASLGATVFSFLFKTGQFSFAIARNKALELVPKDADWIIFTDIDEVFAEESIDIVRAITRNPKVLSERPDCDGVMCEIRTLNDSGNVIMQSRNGNPRVLRWRGVDTLHFEGDLHEQIVIKGKDKQNLMLTNPVIVLNHYGYSESALSDGSKGKRNAEIAKRLLDANPTDLRLAEHYAEALYMSGDLNAAIEVRESRINEILASNDKELVVRMLRSLIQAQQVGGENNDKYFGYALLAKAKYPEVPDWDYLLGLWANNHGFYLTAQVCMQSALSLLPSYEHADGYVGETMVVRAKAEEVLAYWTEYARKIKEGISEQQES
jgi:glycosyltransferase involved in cell wall biosynthesis